MRPKKGGVRLNEWFRLPTGLSRHGYLLRYPRHLQVDQHRLHRTRFIYAGPKNEPPALTDGFSVHIGLERTSPDTTLREHAREQIQDNRCAGGSESLPSETRPSAATRASSGGKKPSWVRWRAALPLLGPETLASISYSAVGARRKAYEQHVRRMLATLPFPT